MDEGTLTKTKEMLDDMHKRNIDMADSIYLLMWVVISERVHDLKLSMHRITAKRYHIWKNKGVRE